MVQHYFASNLFRWQTYSPSPFIAWNGQAFKTTIDFDLMNKERKLISSCQKYKFKPGDLYVPDGWWIQHS